MNKSRYKSFVMDMKDSNYILRFTCNLNMMVFDYETNSYKVKLDRDDNPYKLRVIHGRSCESRD